jgi:cold shock protein
MTATKSTGPGKVLAGSGKVRMFNGEYGFITSDQGHDIFFHKTRITSNEGSDLADIRSGQRVRYEASEGPKGLRADLVTAAS